MSIERQRSKRPTLDAIARCGQCRVVEWESDHANILLMEPGKRGGGSVSRSLVVMTEPPVRAARINEETVEIHETASVLVQGGAVSFGSLFSIFLMSGWRGWIAGRLERRCADLKRAYCRVRWAGGKLAWALSESVGVVLIVQVNDSLTDGWVVPRCPADGLHKDGNSATYTK